MSSPNAFIIIFQGRCGSTYLVEALDSHPEIRCEFETLSALKKQNYKSEHQLAWARNFLTPDADCEVVRGFKTKIRDVIDPDGFADLIRDLDCKIIHLRRKNLVKLTVSSYNSVRLKKRTGDWNAYDESERLSRATFDPDLFESWLHNSAQRAAEEKTWVKELAQPTLTLYYEDFLIDRESYFDRIFRFLGVRSIPVGGKAKKATSDDLRNALSNFDELVARYEGTEYEPMFYEVLVQ